eukprot:3528107-Karenia_brevis.AAC.1
MACQQQLAKERSEKLALEEPVKVHVKSVDRLLTTMLFGPSYCRLSKCGPPICRMKMIGCVTRTR